MSAPISPASILKNSFYALIDRPLLYPTVGEHTMGYVSCTLSDDSSMSLLVFYDDSSVLSLINPLFCFHSVSDEMELSTIKGHEVFLGTVEQANILYAVFNRNGITCKLTITGNNKDVFFPHSTKFWQMKSKENILVPTA